MMMYPICLLFTEFVMLTFGFDADVEMYAPASGIDFLSNTLPDTATVLLSPMKFCPCVSFWMLLIFNGSKT